MSSNAALQRVKRVFNAKKAGHTGSLDPLATGLLPVCLGEATKVSQFLLDSDKEYLAAIQLGVKTDTADSEGQVIEERDCQVDAGQVEQALRKYRGDIEQVPPMYSALKKDGQPLYKLARRGEEVEREARPVTIHRNELVSFQGNRLELYVACSKGTYIRTLAEDLGEDLGCGAHISALRRLRSGCFALSGEVSDRFSSGETSDETSDYADAVVTLDWLEHTAQSDGLGALDKVLVPMDAAIEHMPAVQLPELAAESVRHGQPVLVRHLPADGLVRMYEKKPEASLFIGIGEIDDDGRVAPRRLIVRGQADG
jgi:tRNA pseudouridine55 synthase